MIRFRLRVQLQEYELPFGDTVVGRGLECNLTIDDPLLSREHALIHLSEGRATIRDLGSRNGTFVNGERVSVTTEVELHHGDRVRFGRLETTFSRAVTPRRDLVATAGIRTCTRCSRPFVVQAPSCPSCGEPAMDGDHKRTASQERRDFWLSLEIELVEKALSLFRLDEAEESVARIGEKLDGLISAGKKVGPTEVEAALCAAVRFARARGNARTIGWALDMLRRLRRLPGPELFALLAATPPILLEEAMDALHALLAAQRGRTDLTPAEASCARSLENLVEEIHSFRLQRWDTGAPRIVAQA